MSVTECTTKRCKTCGETKPAADFYANKTLSDGLGSSCKTCHKAYTREYRRQHPELIDKYNREWYEKNREKRLAQLKAKRLADPEWTAEHDHRTTNIRRARKEAAFIEAVTPLVVLERDDGACGICGEDVDPFRFHVDHVIPLSRGGKHCYANVQVAHPVCNARKYTKVDF